MTGTQEPPVGEPGAVGRGFLGCRVPGAATRIGLTRVV
jgi:hypothetical protein